MISINIIIKSQIDVNKLYDRAEYISDKKMRRDILVEEKRIFAEKEQGAILSFLGAEEKSGRTSDIKSSWISNSISCKASLDVIYRLAEHHNVLMIGIDEEKNIFWMRSRQSMNLRKIPLPKTFY